MLTIRTLSQLRSYVKRNRYDSVTVFSPRGRNKNRSLKLAFESYEYDSAGCSCYEPNIIAMHTSWVIYNPKCAGTSYRAFDEVKNIVDPNKYPLFNLPF